MNLKCNCCDGIYNSLDVHFTSACDNHCKHCVDLCYTGLGIKKPDVKAIVRTIVENSNGIDDVLFLGGEPCLYLDELIYCVEEIKKQTNLKVFVTTSVPKTCWNERDKFYQLIYLLDGINLSVQHYKEDLADKIRNTTSLYDRQLFYKELPYKEKIRINLNLVRPYLDTRDEIYKCLKHYDLIGFNSIKISEIQHGKDYYVSFERLFDMGLGSPYSNGCQKYIKVDGIKTPILLKRSCFLCESTLKATIADGLKVISKLFVKSVNNYGVVYEDGTLTKGWI